MDYIHTSNILRTEAPSRTPDISDNSQMQDPWSTLSAPRLKRKYYIYIYNGILNYKEYITQVYCAV